MRERMEENETKREKKTFTEMMTIEIRSHILITFVIVFHFLAHFPFDRQNLHKTKRAQTTKSMMWRP